MGAMALQGPHQVAQKSATTRREEERIWVKWWGEVMSTVFDCDIVGGEVLLFGPVIARFGERRTGYVAGVVLYC